MASRTMGGGEQGVMVVARTEVWRYVSFQYNGRENGKVIKLPKKLRSRVFSFQMYRDANYGVFCMWKVNFVHKYMGSILSLNCAREGIILPNIP